MTAKETRVKIQELLGVTADGSLGNISRAAFQSLAAAPPDSVWPPVFTDVEHHGKASSFADPKDVAAFKRCKAQGRSDMDCFSVGDNGVGCWGDDVSEGTPAACALPPDDMIAKWGSIEAAKHKPVEVSANGKSVTCILKDRMPWRKNIQNQAIIDLNPAAVRALKLEPPIMVTASWRWV